MRAKLYLAYFDELGFETIIDLTDYDKKAMWASLSNKQTEERLPVGALIMRAKLNPHRSPEIWTFQSETNIRSLVHLSEVNPQGLADLIREHGTKVFVTPKVVKAIE